MIIQKKSINELKRARYNPRKELKQGDTEYEKLKRSIEEFGYVEPIIWNERTQTVVGGHQRLTVLIDLGHKEVDCVIVDLPDDKEKALNIALNKIEGEWDNEKLVELLSELNELDFDLELTGFDLDELEGLLNFDMEESIGDVYEEEKGSLQERFIVPPFSILDTRQGYWQDRKNIWKKIIKSDNGRNEELLGVGLKKLAQKQGSNLTGTSIFDPVLTEILLNWFCPKGGKVLDPFAGGSVRGLISVLLGNEYTGIDLSKKQIEANIENYNAISDRQDLLGNTLNKPNWINEDSTNIDKLVKDEYDFMLTCPPYADLEVYSDDPKDISNMPYDKFIATYREIIAKAVGKLKDNAFVAIVVGDVRDKKGYYHNFVGDTVKACKDVGLKYYNECILVEAGGTASLRANKQFNAGRKVVKTHQNVLIFVKGNEKELMKNLKIYDYDFNEVDYADN